MDGLVPVLEGRRAVLREAIPGIFLAAYDVLGRLRRRPVVVPVRSAHCGGCYLRLPPQLDSAVRRRQSLCICPHCRRLIYSPPGGGEVSATNDPTHGLGGRPAVDGGASKPRQRRRGRPGAETPPANANPVER